MRNKKLPPLAIDNYIKAKKLETPLYDPQTGEPNLEYEKLTGKVNPLLDNNFLNNIPIVYEPKRYNRFIVNFPKVLGLPSWVVSSITRPSMSIKHKKFIGITYSKTVEWNSIDIELRDPISPSSTSTIMDLIKYSVFEPFNFNIEMLDPTGVVVERWLLDGCLLESADFGTLNYKDDGIATIKLTIKANKIKLDNSVLNK